RYRHRILLNDNHSHKISDNPTKRRVNFGKDVSAFFYSKSLMDFITFMRVSAAVKGRIVTRQRIGEDE
ncbi:MAG: hypothetical protein E6556_21700, partial [Pantoea sp.]|nr:hypothetical protein [Pantoea sp.]